MELDTRSLDAATLTGQSQYKYKNRGAENPLQSASFWSICWFGWLTWMLDIGFQRRIEHQDIPRMPDQDEAEMLADRFEIEWEKELKMHAESAYRLGRHTNIDTAASSTQPDSRVVESAQSMDPSLPATSADYGAADDAANDMSHLDHEHVYEPSVFRAMMRIVGRRYWIEGVISKVVWLFSALAQVLLLRYIIQFVDDAYDDAISDPPLYKGILYIIGMGITAMMQGISVQQIFWTSTRTGLKVSSALSVAMYRKVMRLHVSALRQDAIGKVTNLVTNDAQRAQFGFTFFHFFWFAGIEISICVGLLFYYVGWTALFGFLALGMLVPLQAWFGKKIGQARRETLPHTDERVRRMDEILNGIRILKSFAWESSFHRLVSKLRGDEIEKLRTAAVYKTSNAAIFFTFSSIVGFAMLATHVVFVGDLDPPMVWTTLSLLNLLSRSLFMVPRGASTAVEAAVSFKRMQKFLLQPEHSSVLSVESTLSEQHATDHVDAQYAVSFRDASFSWSMHKTNPIVSSVLVDIPKNGNEPDATDEKHSPTQPSQQSVANSQVLHDIDWHIHHNSLHVIVGRVGAGKSSLLYAILGELDKASGSLFLSGKLAYASQQPWIFNDTLRENILFGEPYDEIRFERVVEACQLSRDIAGLPNGDASEIGEKGINLSGGQKARVSLARACYSSADIVLLDDVLSAVDQHVGRAIFEQCICGFLQTKTRILVTHQTQYLVNPRVDHVIVVDNGSIAAQGTYDQVSDHINQSTVHLSDPASNDSGTTTATTTIFTGDDEDDSDDNATNPKGRTNSVTIDDDVKSFTEVQHRLLRERFAETLKHSDNNKDKGSESKSPADPNKGALMVSEDRASGTVALSVYFGFFEFGGGVWMFLGVLSVFAFTQGVRVASDWFLGFWAGNDLDESNEFYILWYSVLITVLVTLSIARSLVLWTMMLAVSRNLHDTLFLRVLRAPVVFFDSNPIGRILNRFSRDMDHLDNMLPFNVDNLSSSLMVAFGAFAAIISVFPYFAFAIIPLWVAFRYFQKRFLAVSREIKRIDGITRSPQYAHFSASLQGLDSVRGYGRQKQFTDKFILQVNDNLRARFTFFALGRWLGVRLDMFSAFVVFSTACLCVFLREFVPGNIVGIAMSQSLLLAGLLQWGVRQAAEVENGMTSVERILTYTQIPEEPTFRPKDVVDTELKDVEDLGAEFCRQVIEWARAEGETLQANAHSEFDNWPTAGNVTFDNVWMKYRPNLDHVLRGVSFDIPAGSKVGVVGRTGAGKSSLLVSLFRFTEISAGSIEIDGHEIGHVPLRTLRSQISIIPQDPVLFHGTIRSNLDPFDDYNDKSIYSALKRVHMHDTVVHFSKKLEHAVEEGGGNLSVGQRQLLCMARALLRDSHIICLDEATSNVDNKTDAVIQQTVREAFANATVITIAHRLHTIIDSDLVLVMDHGAAAEYAHPHTLLSDPTSLFSSLVDETGPSHATSLRNAARIAFQTSDTRSCES
jgi:ABC-type multidrug transport system fused ATPase/permease subunit